MELWWVDLLQHDNDGDEKSAEKSSKQKKGEICSADGLGSVLCVGKIIAEEDDGVEAALKFHAENQTYQVAAEIKFWE